MSEDPRESQHLIRVEATARVRLVVGVNSVSADQAKRAAIEAAKGSTSDWDVEDVLVDSLEATEIDPETGGETLGPTGFVTIQRVRDT